MGKFGCALAAFVLVAGATACSDEADGETPAPSKSTTTASATTPSPTSPTPTSARSPTPSEATVPPLPESAKGKGVKAAAHFVEYYIELMNYSATTGDTRVLRASSRHCLTCNNYIELYEKTYRNGGFFENPGWRAADVVAAQEGRRFGVIADIKTHTYKFRIKRGADLSRAKGTTYELRFVVDFHGSGPHMAAIEKQADFS